MIYVFVKKTNKKKHIHTHTKKNHHNIVVVCAILKCPQLENKAIFLVSNFKLSINWLPHRKKLSKGDNSKSINCELQSFLYNKVREISKILDLSELLFISHSGIK